MGGRAADVGICTTPVTAADFAAATAVVMDGDAIAAITASVCLTVSATLLAAGDLIGVVLTRLEGSEPRDLRSLATPEAAAAEGEGEGEEPLMRGVGQRGTMSRCRGTDKESENSSRRMEKGGGQVLQREEGVLEEIEGDEAVN